MEPDWPDLVGTLIRMFMAFGGVPRHRLRSYAERAPALRGMEAGTVPPLVSLGESKHRRAGGCPRRRLQCLRLKSIGSDHRQQPRPRDRPSRRSTGRAGPSQSARRQIFPLNLRYKDHAFSPTPPMICYKNSAGQRLQGTRHPSRGHKPGPCRTAGSVAGARGHVAIAEAHR